MDLKKFSESKIGGWVMNYFFNRLLKRSPKLVTWLQNSGVALIGILQILSDNILNLGISSDVANYISIGIGILIFVIQHFNESTDQKEAREIKKNEKQLRKEIKNIGIM